MWQAYPFDIEDRVRCKRDVDKVGEVWSFHADVVRVLWDGEFAPTYVNNEELVKE